MRILLMWSRISCLIIKASLPRSSVVSLGPQFSGFPTRCYSPKRRAEGTKPSRPDVLIIGFTYRASTSSKSAFGALSWFCGRFF